MLTDDDIERALAPLRSGVLRAPFAGAWLAPPFTDDGATPAGAELHRVVVARDADRAHVAVDRDTGTVLVVDAQGEERIASSPESLALRAGLFTAALAAAAAVDPGDHDADARLGALERVLLDQLGKADPSAAADGFWAVAAEEVGAGVLTGAHTVAPSSPGPPATAPTTAPTVRPGVLVALTPAESDAFFSRDTWRGLADAADVRVVSAPQRLAGTLEAIELLDAQRGRTTPAWRVLVAGPSTEPADRLPDGLLPAGCAVVDVREAGPEDVLAALA